MAKVNRKRRKSEFERCYGSKERVEKIKALPCSVPGCTQGPSDNAHIERDGMSLKAGWDKVVPLCRTHHRQFDVAFAGHVPSFDAQYRTDLRATAAKLAREIPA